MFKIITKSNDFQVNLLVALHFSRLIFKFGLFFWIDAMENHIYRYGRFFKLTS